MSEIRGPRGYTGGIGAKGDKGDIGLTGSQGPIGNTGASAAAGLTGEIGSIGPRGFDGPEGPSGLNGTNGTNGTNGLNGSKGDTGDKGNTGDTGATGPIGPTGLTGLTGPIGPLGPSPNVFYCLTSINSVFQPVNGLIPINTTSVKGLTDGQIMIRHNIIFSNNVSVNRIGPAGNYVSNADVPYCSFGIFDNETGIFTVTEPGLYSIDGSFHLKSNQGSDVFWQTGATPGSMGLGLLEMGNNLYSGNFMTVLPNINRQLDVTAGVVTYLNIGDKIRMSILNLTDRSYDGNTYVDSADVIRFSVTQLYKFP